MNIKKYTHQHFSTSYKLWTMESKWNFYNYVNYYYYGNGFYDLEEINNNPYGIMIDDRYIW